MALRPADIRTFAHWLSPDYLIPAAKDHGEGDPVLGAERAYMEVRGLLRNYARFMAWRDRGPVAGLGLANALRAMGYVGNYQPVVPLEEESDWRRTACAFWPDGVGGRIRGYVDVEVGKANDAKVYRSVMRALARVLIETPQANRAVLQGRVYQRTSEEIMLHVEGRADEVRSVILNPLGMNDRMLKRRLWRAFRGAVSAENHHLRPVAGMLMRAWAKTGFIASPAAAMVSPVGSVGVKMGTACLVPANGIPLSITVGENRDGVASIGLEADHRAFDATACGKIYEGFESLVPEYAHG